MPVQRETSNRIRYRGQVRQLQDFECKIVQKAVQWQGIGAYHLEIGQR